VTEIDREILETWLDGELEPPRAAALQIRLATEADLSALLAELRDERQIRQAVLAALGPTPAHAERIADRICADLPQPAAWRIGPFVRTAWALAACTVLSFGLGWLVRGGGESARAPQPAMQVTPAVYQVNICDESGTVIGVQHFNSPEQARQFSEDIERWQERQEQLRSGLVVVRSARF
jgi:hypothetical protein